MTAATVAVLLIAAANASAQAIAPTPQVTCASTSTERTVCSANTSAEHHESLATRFGMTTARSRESQQQLEDGRPENTQTKLADRVSLFETGARAGIFIQAEFFSRWIDGFDANGVLPVNQIFDKGFYVQSASPASSTFGFYVGGQKGPTVTVAPCLLF